MLGIGPLEELGYRDLGLPLLQQRFAPFVLGEPDSGRQLGPVAPAGLRAPRNAAACLGVRPVRPGRAHALISLTPMFNAAHSSILVAMLFPFQRNGPAWLEAQPFENYRCTVAAVVIVLHNRRTMFSPAGAVTEILSRDDAALPMQGTPCERSVVLVRKWTRQSAFLGCGRPERFGSLPLRSTMSAERCRSE